MYAQGSWLGWHARLCARPVMQNLCWPMPIPQVQRRTKHAIACYSKRSHDGMNRIRWSMTHREIERVAEKKEQQRPRTPEPATQAGRHPVSLE